jgi:FMN phosphatase YigB (HAD superfamily)
MFAAHILFASDRLREVDLIVAPLFGAIDLEGALRFLYNHGNDLYQQVTGKEFVPATKPPLIKLLHKISPRGIPRSQMPGLMDALPQTMDVLDREDIRVKEQLKQAQHVLIIDDSVGTFASAKKISEFIRVNTNGHALQIDFLAAHGGIRWAEAQHASRSAIADAEAVAVTPLSHTFKKPVYSWGSAYLPDAEIARRLLYTTRTIIDFSELTPIVKDGFQQGVIQGVGFDLYETLVKRTVPRAERRRMLYELGADVFAEYGYSISPEEYGAITRPVWLADLAQKGQTHEEINYFETVSNMVRAVFVARGAGYTVGDLDAMTRKICANELQFELETTVADEGVLETLKQFQRVGIPLGIYSNTPYMRTDMLYIIRQTRVSQFIPAENMLFSSETGIIKPSSKTIDLLAATMRVQKSNLAFVGNSLDDIRAAANARAIPVLRIFEKEHPNLQQRLMKWRRTNTDYETRNS